MRKKLFKVLGVLLISGGIILIVFTAYTHLSYSKKMSNLLDNRVIVSNSETEDTVDSNSSSNVEDTYIVDSDIQDFAIESLDEDQKVAEIKTGTPVISIPSLNITVPVINGTDTYSLKLGAGKFEHSANMGDIGNFAVAGHSSTIYNCIFNDLESIQLLDEIDCYNETGKEFKYYVTNMFKTNPDNIDVTFSSTESTMTIITCTENGTRRFVVSAKLMSDDEFSKYKKSLKAIQLSKAVELADSESDIDIMTYLKSGSFISKIPYRIKYLVEDYDSFFTNYVITKDKLKVNKHEYFIAFNNPLGVDLSAIITEVTKR